MLESLLQTAAYASHGHMLRPTFLQRSLRMAPWRSLKSHAATRGGPVEASCVWWKWRVAISEVTAPCGQQGLSLRAGLQTLRAVATDADASDTAAGEGDEFDWKLGVALGGCSFEAYNDPEHSDGLCEASPKGSRIFWSDKDFLLSKMKGLLEVTVKSASNLPAADMWPGKSDPYAIVQIGDSSCTTKVVSSNLNPVWDETFLLFVRSLKQRMVIRVMDQDIGKSDDFLGSTMRGLTDLCDGQQHRLTLDLQGAKGAAGQVHLDVRFLPFTEVLAEGARSGAMASPVLGSPARPLLARMPDMHLGTGKPSPWRELAQLAGVAVKSKFRPLCFIENTVTDSQAWLFWNPQARQVCVAFRGTEQAKWKDILVDLSLVPSALNPERVASVPRNAALAEASKAPSLFQKVLDTVGAARSEVENRRAQQQQQQRADKEGGVGLGSAAAAKAAVLASMDAVSETAGELQAVLDRVKQTIAQAEARKEGEQGRDQPWVHHGFLTAYDSIRPQVLGVIDSLLLAAEEEGSSERQPWTVYVTGHSLGGALSTLCAYDLAARTGPNRTPPSLVLVNFGSPRVGNRAFAAEFNSMVPNAWRVVNRNDAVCTVPRLMGYCHVGHAVRLKAGGKVEVQRDTSDVLGEGLAIPEVLPAALPKLTSKMLETVGLEVAKAAAAEEGIAPAAAAALNERDVDEILEQEMEAWSLLLGGSSVSEHMEDLYLESLRAFAQAMAEGQGQEAAEA